MSNYPIRFSIDFPGNSRELPESETLTIATLYNITKEIVEKGGQVTTKTYFQNGGMEEAVLGKVSDIYALFGKP
ncbi:hypothetical protein LJC56_02735 [Christensenellaceae bacterium OttesenSCG-928-K19]|nr:hypothetical protein [Christensenellaceae bacterium OttesenSCG-928-K19]